VSKERLLIRGGTVLSLDPDIGELPKGDVLVEDGLIVAVAPEIDAEDCEVLDATDTIVMPGFVDTHRHVWQAPWRNIASDWSLAHYFTGLHAGLSGHYRPQDTYIGNLLGTLEALDAGITTLLDWSHNLNTPDHADGAVEALFESGARVVFAHGGGAPEWQVPSDVPHTRDAKRVKEQWFSSDQQLVTMAMALRGPQFAPGDTSLHDWALARELGTRITVHVGDGEWGKTRPIQWLADHDLLADDITYVHCNTLADDELGMIAASGGTASVAADIELQMGHGWPATGRLLAAGIRPSLSIDVCTATAGHMFGAMKTTLLTQRGLDNAAVEAAGGSASENASLALSCRDVLGFATMEGARAVGLDDRVGSLTPGKAADVILIRTDSLGMTPMNNPAGAVVYNGHPGLVETVIVGGRFAKRDGKLVGIDTDRVRRLAVETRDHLLATAQGDPRLHNATTGGDWVPEVYVPGDEAADEAAGDDHAHAGHSHAG
jgi:5-methylthioadenosine/S-adenosylhomocysteine deaminase